MTDLNCDMGEGMANDALIMPFVTSCNIACGFHAGNGELIRRTMDLARQYGVKIGAHPSFRDREHFGRRDLYISNDKLYALVLEQLIKLDLIAREKGMVLHHVKPHGALYNMAAREKKMASVIAQAVVDFNEALVVYGLSGSFLISEAASFGLKTCSEVFADRTYMDDGSLCPRSMEGAVIEEEGKMLEQVMQMVKQGTVTTLSGKTISIKAETIGIHSDGKKAPFFAKAIRESLDQLSSLYNQHP